MVVSKPNLIVWLLVTLTLGLAGGYLFSSKFCSISIGKRVEKISTLNQTLRKLFALRTFYIFELAQSQSASSADQTSLQSHLSSINSQISSLIGAYYDKQTTHKIQQLLDAQEDIAPLLAELNQSWAHAGDLLKNNFTQSTQAMQNISQAVAGKNWERTYYLFEKELDNAMELADEIDKGITQQFPSKF